MSSKISSGRSSGGDAAQVDRLFRESGLLRAKWDERHFADGSTYGEKTIERAIAGTDEFYEPPTAARETSRTSGIDREMAIATAQSASSERNAARLERLETLELALRNALDETERLRAELESERTQRRDLEAELEQLRAADDTGRWWLPW